jgi:hypothetical protein
VFWRRKFHAGAQTPGNDVLRCHEMPVVLALGVEMNVTVYWPREQVQRDIHRWKSDGIQTSCVRWRGVVDTDACTETPIDKGMQVLTDVVYLR